jgi:ActR/RegA family two-component response regulator
VEVVVVVEEEVAWVSLLAAAVGREGVRVAGAEGAAEGLADGRSS